MMREHSFATPASRLALGGMMSLMSLACLYIVSIAPTARLFFFVLASMIPAVLMLKADATTALLSYIAVICLGYVLMPRKISLIPYSLFFGYYAVLKYYLEKLPLWLEVILKAIAFNTAMYFSFRLIENLILLPVSEIDISPILLIAISTLLFFIYDYVFSYFITVLQKKLIREM